MILGALNAYEYKDPETGKVIKDKSGGQAYLEVQRDENPEAFMTLLGKIVPREIKAEVLGALTMTLNGKGVGPQS